jgi:hypothetical protein
LATDIAQRIERRVNRIDSSHVQTGWQNSGASLPLLSENIAEDARRIAQELIGELPEASG